MNHPRPTNSRDVSEKDVVWIQLCVDYGQATGQAVQVCDRRRGRVAGRGDEDRHRANDDRHEQR